MIRDYGATMPSNPTSAAISGFVVLQTSDAQPTRTTKSNTTQTVAAQNTVPTGGC
jgi:hypothetical protein